MGGVDVHDQLRLQRYSLQLARRYKKYYKSLFLGLMDLAIINAFIIYNYRRVADGKSKVSHVRFLKELHLQLCQLQDDDWDQLIRDQGLQPTPTKSNRTVTAHVPVQTDEWRKGNGNETRKRRQRACKVCSVLKREDQSRGGETTFYCAACKLKTSSMYALASRVFLCNKVKHSSNGVATSCFEVWHKHWRDGTRIPQTQRKRKLRARKPARASADGDAEDSGAQSSEESETGSPPSSRQRTHTTVDGVED
uniref:PiggyBac transposable element-derived protein domain-containing protein n=2 Tax=Phytophthora ramorum TaxID=164328 RepID=H3GNA7_PHYRM